MSRSLIKQIRKAYDYQSSIESLRNQPFRMPLDLATPMLEYMMERSYFENLDDRKDFVASHVPGRRNRPISWIKINRIPIHPSQAENYDLLTKWQAVLTSLHAWRCKTIFMLQRRHGETNLYIGLQGKSLEGGIGLLRSALINCMPGIEAEPIDNFKASDIDERAKGTMELSGILDSYSVGGAITGVPSFRKETQSKFAQTLDQLAFGIRTERNEEADFSLIVVAEPMSDEETSDIINKYQKLGSDIHSEVSAQVNDSETKTEGEGRSNSFFMNFGLGQILNTAASALGGPIMTVASMGATFVAATLWGTSLGASKGYSSNNGVSVGRSVASLYSLQNN